MNINHRISNAIKERDNIDGQIKYLQTVLSIMDERVNNLISTYLQENNGDQLATESLVRYLYWYSNLDIKDICRITELTHQKIVAVSGKLVKNEKCRACQCQFVAVFHSRSASVNPICEKCVANSHKEYDEVFLEDWVAPGGMRKGFTSNREYKEYLGSTHWRMVRKTALKNANYKCQACSARNVVLNVHHNNYDCLYREKPQDLIVLCRPCHVRIHAKDK